ncbi:MULTISPECIES: DUF452 family protein [Odoribacteraceae]|uniref:DUF452 family protein n=1 Tax=Odoribacteraceae TaxID=1853231 RepID=UPI000E513CD1|nr:MULTISPECIES: pimeloyl-ACP methyl esterase BioG family protein [Odoribacteraceae]MCQ4874051.1 DUF452 family protein [Butyricimonas paravirosa]RHR82911.1 DUF452 family protein [Odoribacter sp. AF15-53]
MRRVWITRKGSGGVTLFFCGWGMDERAVQHLTGEDDLLVFNDYRDISEEEAPALDTYERVRVVAWSMGVWAASVLLNRWNIPVSESVAINGTERPVDERYGIHPRIYLLTERGMTEEGRDKFFARMLSGEDEVRRFEANKPRRELDEQRDELRLIREQSARQRPEWGWNRAYVSGEDVIFPVGNQRDWWKDRCEVIALTGGHYPFYVLDKWDMI